MKYLRFNKKIFISIMACFILLISSGCNSGDNKALEENLNAIQVLLSDEEKTGTIETGDVVKVKIARDVDGIVEIIEDDNNYQVSNAPYMPLYMEKFVGLKKGDTIEVPQKYDDNPDNGALAGKTFVDKVTVIKVLQLREANDELAELFVEYSKDNTFINFDPDLIEQIKSLVDLKEYLKTNPIY